MSTVSLPQNDRATWLQGPNSQCSLPPTRDVLRPYRVVLLGAPGVGKGTQAQLLQKSLRTCHLSTGDVFRNAKAQDPKTLSPAMAAAVECMKKGELVPDSTVLDMIRERKGCLSCRGGFILDGFPRTVPQAQALDAVLLEQGVHLDAVFNFVMPIDQIVDRLSGRRTCANCKAVYHVTGRPPKVAGVCDSCGGKLLQREDDLPESIRTRMAAYEELTSPLAAYYEARKLLLTIEASGTPETIYTAAIAALRLQRGIGL